MEVLTKSVISSLNELGITDVKEIIYNPSYEELFDYEMSPSLEGYEKGQERSRLHHV